MKTAKPTFRGLCLLAFLTFFLNLNLQAQPSKCIDLGVGVGLGNGEYGLIDFFRDGGSWTPRRYNGATLVNDSMRTSYRVYSLNEFKVVNGCYWTYDSDWSQTINNQAWGNGWSDTYMSYWHMMVDQAKILPSGYPVSIPLTIYKYKTKSVDPNQGIDNTKPITIGDIERRIYFPKNLPADGWILRWKGKGTFSYQGIEVTSPVNCTATDNGNSWTTGGYGGKNYTFTSPGGTSKATCKLFWMVHGWVLTISSSDIADPIRDIEFIYPGLEATLDGGQNIHPFFVDKMKEFKALRWMGYMDANGLASRVIFYDSHPFRVSHMLKEMTWSERTVGEWYKTSNGNGGKHELIVEASNLTRTHPWVNIPYAAGKDYVYGMIKYYMANLDPDLTLYIELGNELWNFGGGFNGFHWMNAMKDYFYPGLGTVEACGSRINEINGWVAEAAGTFNLNRIVRINPARPDYEDWANRLTMYIKPENWDAIASTWYFGLPQDNNAPCKAPSGKTWRLELWDWYKANPDNQTGFNAKYKECVLGEFRCSQDWRNKADVKIAKSYGKKVVCYEGGNHSFYGCTNAPTSTQSLQNYDASEGNELEFDNPVYPEYITNSKFINRVCEADKSSALGEIYNEVIDSMKAAGVLLANHLSYSGTSSCYGVWSFMDSKDMGMDLTSLYAKYPKLKAFSDRIDAENCNDVFVNLPPNSAGAGLSALMDGANDFVQADAVTFKPDESSNYTMEAWFKPAMLDTNQYILAFANSTNVNSYNAIFIRTDNKIVWESRVSASSSAKLVGPVVEFDKWYHVSVTKSGQRYTLYLNGKNVASVNATLATATRNKFTIGAFIGASRKEAFRGQIDEVRVWNVARTEAEVRDYMCKKVATPLPAELRIYFRFDDGNNDVNLDNSAGTGNGTMNNMSFTERSCYTVSGAPIGDISRNRYETVWSGISLSLTHSEGDMVAVSNLGTGNPEGVHIYYTNAKAYFNTPPQHYDGISTNKYFGVFVVNGTDPTYDLNYVYAGNPQAKTGTQETMNRLLKKNSSADADWIHSGAKMDVVSQSFALACKEYSKGEYTLGFRRDDKVQRPGSGKAIRYVSADADGRSQGQCRYMPKYYDYTFTCWAKGNGVIFDMFRTVGQGDGEYFGIGSQGSTITFEFRKGADGRGGNSGNGDPTEWNHYTVIRKGTNITILVNGMNVFSQEWIGINFYNEMNLCKPASWMGAQNLQIDEVTLWNVALDQQTIRDWMCKKITTLHPNSCKNLLLYFTFDEGQGTILEDKFGGSDMTCVPGYFDYVTSGAAVGNESANDYVTPNDLSLTHPQSDQLSALRTAGTAVGVHIYRNDYLPPIPAPSGGGILSVDSTRYWGLFVAKAAGTATTYSVTYKYAGNTSINPGHESELRLIGRKDNFATNWPTISGAPAAGNLTLANQFRGEYILGGTQAATIVPAVAPSTPTITGTTTICGNTSGLVYRISPKLTNAAQYIWSLPSGLDGYSTADTIVINASYFGTTPQTFTISVVGVNNYGRSTPPGTLPITVNPMPTIADAGPNQLIIPPTNSAIMDGNAVKAGETGTWTKKLGAGTIVAVNNPLTNITGLVSGVNVFVWTISVNSGACPSSVDSTRIILAPPPQGITLTDNKPLPTNVCGSTTLNIKAIPPEDIVPTSYQWEVPAGISVLSQSGNTAIIQMAASGIGGKIKARAVYNGSPSIAVESSSISITAQPNKPVFLEEPSTICYKVIDTLKASIDATIDSFVWTMPFGVYPTTFPKSTSATMVYNAIEMASGYISIRAYHDGCTNINASDSFAFTVSQAPPMPQLYLGSDYGVADAICENNDAILWVGNADTAYNYIWTWETGFNLVRYYGENHNGILLHQTANQPIATVYAVRKNGGACATTNTFHFNSWPQGTTPVGTNAVSITDPVGTNATQLVVGTTYTAQMPTVGGANGYYFVLPAGTVEVPTPGWNNMGDNTIRFRVTREFAGDIVCFVASQTGCTGTPRLLPIGTPNGIRPPDYVSGNTQFCSGASNNLNITVQNVGADSYEWTLPNGTKYTTVTNVITQTVNTAMHGDLTIVAIKGAIRSNPSKVQINIDASTILPLTFVDAANNPISDVSICSMYASGSSRYYLYVRDANAASYTYYKGGAPIDWESRYCPLHGGVEDPQHLGRDTSYSFGWTSWRMQDGHIDGYLKVRATANPACSNNYREDSIYWHYEVSPDVTQPVFEEAPTALCAGSSATYRIKPIGGAVQYIWSLPNGLTATSITTTEPQITANVSYGTGGKVSVYAISTSCGGGETPIALTENITIQGAPVDFHFINPPSAACPGDVLTFKVNDIGSAQYLWTLPGGGSTIQIDDADATGITYSGSWTAETFGSNINGNAHRRNNDATAAYARYTPTITQAGTYRVTASAAYQYDNSTSVKVHVVHKNGTNDILINELVTSGPALWLNVGNFEFNVGTGGYVDIATNAAGGVVRADAVKFELLGTPDDTSVTFTVTGTQSGSVCVAAPVAGCPTMFSICTDVNLGGNLLNPLFSAQANSVCEGQTYTYTINNIGADSIIWTVPTGWTIGGKTGRVSLGGTNYTVQVVVGAYNASTQRISVFGKLNCGSKVSTTVQTNDIVFGSNCKLATPVFTAQPATVCIGSTITFTVNAVPNATSYSWVLPAGLRQNGSGATGTVSTVVPSIIIEGTSIGPKGQITVRAKAAGITDSDIATSTSSVTVGAGVNAGRDTTITRCNSDAVVDMQSLAIRDIGGNWKNESNATVSNLINPALLTPATYTFMYTLPAAGCGSDSAEVIITISAAVNAGADVTTSACMATTSLDIAASIDPLATPAGIWKNDNATGSLLASTTVNPSILGIGTFKYRYVVDGGSCGKDSSIITLTVTNLSDAGTTSVTTVCNSETNVDLFSKLTGTPQANAGDWKNSAGTKITGFLNATSLTVGNTYTFWYVITNAQCGNDSASLTVMITAAPNVGNDATITVCSSVTSLALISNLGGTPDAGGTWKEAVSTGALNNGVFNPNQAGVKANAYEFYYVIDGGSCGKDSSTLSVNVVSTAKAGTDNAGSACTSTSSVDMKTFLSSDADANGVWTSLTSGANLTLSTLVPSTMTVGIYRLAYIVTQTGNCSSTDTAIITMTIAAAPSPNLAVTNDTVCAGVDASLTIVNAQAGNTYQLTKAGANVGSPVTAVANGDLQITVPNASLSTGVNNFKIEANVGNCNTTLNAIPTVEVIAKPAPIILGSTSTCANKVLAYSVINNPANTYLWSISPTMRITDSTTNAITVNVGIITSATLTVLVSDPNTGCNGSDSIIITGDITPPTITKCPGNIALLGVYDPKASKVSYNISDNVLDIIATDDCAMMLPDNSFNRSYTLNGSTIVLPVDSSKITITWTISDSSNNSSTCVINLELQVDDDLHIFNAFSPSNKDGINDFWTITNSELYPELEVFVYNRWGMLVWKSTKPYQKWDGKDTNGKIVPTDSYHYRLIKSPNEKPKLGTITVL